MMIRVSILLAIMLQATMRAPSVTAFSVRANYRVLLSNTLAKNTGMHTSTTLQSSFTKEDGSTSKNRKNRLVEESSSKLSAIAIDEQSAFRESTTSTSSLIPPVLSAALLITGNTVGASCLVLPETAAPLGMGASTCIFILAFAMHLISGLTIAEVAIKQHEELGTDVPSSFKAFADENMNSKIAANGVSAVSLFVNFCVLAFDLTRAGTVGSSLLHIPEVLSISSTEASVAFATIIASLVVTLSSEKLATVASCAVTVLFCSFAGLLLPELASVHDPMSTFMTVPSSTDDLVGAMIRASPIIVQAAVYQNIVPSVTKILNYDRKKCMSAIFLGSLLPTLMFVTWCFTSLSGGSADGTSMSMMTSSPFFTSFSVAALCGSSLGCIMSMSEELEQWSKNLFPKDTISQQKEQDDGMLVVTKVDSTEGTMKEENLSRDASSSNLSLPSVMLATSMPLLAGILCSSGGRQDIASAFLACAGAYGTPLLYGAVPVVMAVQQRNRFPTVRNLVPTASLGLIGTGSFAFVVQEISKDFPSLANGFPM